MMEVITGLISVMHSLRSHVGRGSSSHDLLADCRTIDSTSAVLTQFNTFNGTPLNILPECLYAGARSMSNFKCNVSLISLIFVTECKFIVRYY